MVIRRTSWWTTAAAAHDASLMLMLDSRTAAIDDLAAHVRARRNLPPPATRRVLRQAAGASLADVGNACGVTRQAVAQWEAGLCTPRGPNLLAYVEVLAVFRESDKEEQ